MQSVLVNVGDDDDDDDDTEKCDFAICLSRSLDEMKTKIWSKAVRQAYKQSKSLSGE